MTYAYRERGRIGAEEVAASVPGRREEAQAADRQCHRDREVAIERPAQTARRAMRTPRRRRSTPSTSSRATSPSASVTPFQTNSGTRPGAGSAIRPAVTPVRDEPQRRRRPPGRPRWRPRRADRAARTDERRTRRATGGRRPSYIIRRRSAARPRSRRARKAPTRAHDQGSQPERERRDERDLPRGEEVLRTGAEHGEHRARTTSRPRRRSALASSRARAGRRPRDERRSRARRTASTSEADDRVERTEREDRDVAQCS